MKRFIIEINDSLSGDELWEQFEEAVGPARIYVNETHKAATFAEIRFVKIRAALKLLGERFSDERTSAELAGSFNNSFFVELEKMVEEVKTILAEKEESVKT